MVVLAADGTVRGTTPPAWPAWGYGPGELGGRPWSGLLHPDDRDLAGLDDQLRSVAAGQPARPLELRLRRADGTHGWLEIRSARAGDRAETPDGLVFMCRDISRHKSSEFELQRRLGLERSVAAIAVRLARATAAVLDQEIGQALADLGGAVGVDRTYVFRIGPDGQTMSNTHEWCAAGISPERANLQNVPVASVPWWMDKLAQSAAIDIVDVAQMPDEAATEREILRAQGIQSALVMPMFAGGQLVGFVGFDAVTVPVVWTQSHLALLRIAGEVLAAAIVRAAAEQTRQLQAELLESSERRYERLTTHADTVIFAFAADDGRITYINQAGRNLLGYSVGQVMAQPALRPKTGRGGHQRGVRCWAGSSAARPFVMLCWTGREPMDGSCRLNTPWCPYATPTGTSRRLRASAVTSPSKWTCSGKSSGWA